MAHRYGQEIRVSGRGEADGRPSAFGWRGIVYQVAEVLSSWHLRDRWWQTDGGSAPVELGMPGLPRPGASDRTYYRVRCAPALLCEIYHDAVTDTWVLDRVCD